jgi:hypothetical protein
MMRAAVGALKQLGPQRFVVAVPTAAEATCRDFQAEVDECVCVSLPEWFLAVGLSYLEFPQISDEEVREILDRALGRSMPVPSRFPPLPGGATHSTGPEGRPGFHDDAPARPIGRLGRGAR